MQVVAEGPGPSQLPLWLWELTPGGQMFAVFALTQKGLG